MGEGNILIIEDDAIVADNTASILIQAGYSNIHIADTLDEILKLIKKVQISLIISDVNLHGIKNGPGIVKAIQQRINAPVIYLTAYSEEQTVNDALATHSIAFVLKPFTERQLLVAVQIAFKQIQELNQGGEPDRPTKREAEIIDCIAKGLNNREIADTLFLSEHTVKAHRRNLLKKYSLRSSSELVAMAMRMKWIHLS